MEARPIDAYSDLEQAGLIQRFEFTFELGWKVMKDFLEYNGITIDAPIGPRSVIKTAFSSTLIDDGQVWINMMNHRNRLSHEYSGSYTEEVLKAVKDHYLSALGSLHGTMIENLEKKE